jgi:peptidoglycan/xylan/chitin deacetylase (PgdA/CDA1 family)
MRRTLLQRIGLYVGTAALLVAIAAVSLRFLQRPAAPPLYASGNLLINPGFQEDVDGNGRPDGWEAGPAAELSDWLITPEAGGHSLRLTGSGSYVRSSVVQIWPGKTYHLSLQALTDADEPNRLQAVFIWEDTRREVLERQKGPWLEVPAQRWTLLEYTAEAPAQAAGLSILLRPAGDSPVYLDDLRLSESGVRLEPFPDYSQAALAFTLDWETTMAGLIHSRSDDGYDPTTAEDRGLAMREGTRNLLALLGRYDIQATWYAAGYSLLPGNVDGRAFSDDPIYSWASPANGWRNDRWLNRPWFADDPQGTTDSHPAWYFGDLIPELVEAGQDIQTHTFGHLYVGLASPEELRIDLEQWNAVAREAGLSPARTLAFPWGASLGTSDTHYAILEDLGYIAVTRTYHAPQGRSQYWILPPNDLFHLRTVPGHPQLWAFPDHYFPAHPEDANWAKAAVDRVLLERGVTSLWAHSEEVVTPEQIATWEEVLAYADAHRESGLWIAPLTEIVQFRCDLRGIEIQSEERGKHLEVVVRNRNDHTVAGLTLTLPKPVREVRLEDNTYTDFELDQVRLPPLEAGQQVRLQVYFQEWEASP